MPTWLLAVRATALLWSPPVGPIVALVIAIASCIAIAVRTNRRLRRVAQR
jgi:hypothetical protein